MRMRYEAQQLPLPTGGGEKWLTQHFCQSLDEEKTKEDPQLQLQRCQNKAIGILKTRQGEGFSSGFKSAFRG